MTKMQKNRPKKNPITLDVSEDNIIVSISNVGPLKI